MTRRVFNSHNDSSHKCSSAWNAAGVAYIAPPDSSWTKSEGKGREQETRKGEKRETDGRGRGERKGLAWPPDSAPRCASAKSYAR